MTKTPKKRTYGRVILASLNAWATAFGTDSNHFASMLQRAGITFQPMVDINAVDVFKAITFRSEKDEAIARLSNAKAEREEMDNKKARGELMELVQIERTIWNDLLGPLRQELEQMPKNLSGLCNPEKPETAQKVLADWVEATKERLTPKL